MSFISPRMIEVYRSDRDYLLSEYCNHKLIDNVHVPALVIDEIIQDILELDLVNEPLPPKQLGETNYDLRLVRINDQFDCSDCPNADREGIESFTKAHELGHWRIPNHETDVRAESAVGQMAFDILPEKTVASIICRAPWDTARRSFTKKQQRREIEADRYAKIFLVPEAELMSTPEAIELTSLIGSNHVSGNLIWRLVYKAAKRFHVSPTMMKNVLVDLSIISFVGGQISISNQKNIDS